jgi:hypothetical protein
MSVQVDRSGISFLHDARFASEAAGLKRELEFFFHQDNAL